MRISLSRQFQSRKGIPEVETAVSAFLLLPPPRRAHIAPLEVQQPPRPLRANALTRSSRPQLAGAEKPPARFACTPLGTLCRENEKDTAAHAASPHPLRICQPLSSSSCRNYRSRHSVLSPQVPLREPQPPLPDLLCPRWDDPG